MYLLTIILPFIGTIFTFLLGSILGQKGSSFLTTICICFSCIFSWLLGVQNNQYNIFILNLGIWFKNSTIEFNWLGIELL